jgi:2-polyprenyl-6-methoxyphenol hydroxylase-like FAD-dependent oxidoreductase
MDGRGLEVLVVGAGIAGLATARTLHDWGATVQIVERAAQQQAGGTGIYLPGDAVRALDRLGLADQVAGRAIAIHRQQVSDQHGRELFHIDTDEVWQGVGQCLALPRADLHQVLLAGAKEVPIRWACSPRTITDTPDGVRVEFSDGTSGAYDLVIGADGVHSTVRRLIFGDVGVRQIGQYAHRFLVQWPDAPPVWSLMLGARSVFLTLPVGADQVYCYCDSPLAEPPALLHDLVREYPEPVPSLVDRSDVAVYAAPNEEVVLERWSHGAVLLVGDAAHATSPNMAQGAAMAFEDAIVLFETLATASSIADALRMYEQRRRPRTDWVLSQTHRRDATRRLPASVRNFLFRRAGRKSFHIQHRLLRTEP